MVQRALTLVELLVVLGIILLLSALLLSVFASAKQSSKHAACGSNQKQICQAAYLYAGDHGTDEFPELGPLTYVPYGSTYYFETQYVKSLDVLFCPEWPKSRKGIAGTYGMFFYGDPYDPGPTLEEDGVRGSALRGRHMELKEKLGPDMPTVICNVHDQLHYQPREGLKGEPWLIWTRDDGSLKSGRMKGLPRTHMD